MKIPNGVDIDEGATGRAGARFRIHLGCTARSIVCMYPSTHSHLPLTCLFSLRWRVQTMLQKQKQDRQNILSLPRPHSNFDNFLTLSSFSPYWPSSMSVLTHPPTGASRTKHITIGQPIRGINVPRPSVHAIGRSGHHLHIRC